MKRRLLVVGNSMHPLIFRPWSPWRPLLGGIPFDIVNAPRALRLPDIRGYSHLLLTGSEASLLGSYDWCEREADLVRQAVSRGIPVFGSCFGHQMLVHALSGARHVERSANPEIGWTHVEMSQDDPLFAGIPARWSSFVYHLDEVVDPPAPWRVIGASPRCATHVLRYGDHPVWGIQAHPEIALRRARLILRVTALRGMKSIGGTARALRDAPPSNNVAERLIANFLAVPVAGG